MLAITVIALLIPASAILLHQYRNRTLAPGDQARDAAPPGQHELPKAA